jgi:hypothetical protein
MRSLARIGSTRSYQKVVWSRICTLSEGEPMHRKVAAAVCAALMLAVTACGGGEGGDELTRAQLAGRVERACTEATERAQEDARDAGRGGDGVTALLTAVSAAQENISARIEGLEPPEELSDEWEAFKEGIGERADIVARAAASARGGNDRALQEVEAELAAIGRRLQASAQALGLRSCL